MSEAKKSNIFPDTIYVHLAEVDAGAKYFAADEDEVDAIEDDGPTEVAVYRLDRVKRLRKVAEEM